MRVYIVLALLAPLLFIGAYLISARLSASPETGTPLEGPERELSRALAQSEEGWHPLHRAVLADDGDEVRALIAEGADLDVLNPGTNWTALDVAALYNRDELLSLLIESWEGSRGREYDNDRLLRQAAIHGHYETAAYLIERGADVNGRSHDAEPYLRMVATHAHNDVLGLLLEHGANVHATTSEGWTALHGACEKGAEGVRILLEYGADRNVRAGNGYTPLHVAAAHGQAEAARVLLNHGASVDALGNDGLRPLDVAIRHGHANVARVLQSH